MIHFFPRLDCRIRVKKCSQDICSILESVTDPRGEWFNTDSAAVFVGKVNSSGFKIVPKPRNGYRNSFSPVIEGRITGGKNVAIVDVKMRLHLFARIFLVVWFGGVGYALLAGILGIMAGKLSEGISFTIVPILLIVFGQGLIRIGFYPPAKQALRRLEEMLT
ncbi:MAG: hypothetical protein K2J99_07295 [Lachnospiraceae bacterium]|nr:hypothetical protein [Lachnospiraceae bacterium]